MNDDNRWAYALIFLTAGLVLLKAVGVIKCSWWLVTAALWIPLGLVGVVSLTFLLTVASVYLFALLTGRIDSGEADDDRDDTGENDDKP